MKRYLIVNADDFGLSAGVNRGIIECHEHGILTSASLMVRWPTAVEAAAYAGNHPAISVGLHLDLGEWVLRNGEWESLYQVVDIKDAKSVAAEIQCQVAEFRRLVGRDPSHLDSHQHVHRKEPVRTIMLEVGQKLAIPLRECVSSIHYCGSFYGQGGNGESLPQLLTVTNLTKLLAALPAGVSELGCHPGYADDLESPYRHERVTEIRVLCDPQTRLNVDKLGFTLCHFGDPAFGLTELTRCGANSVRKP